MHFKYVWRIHKRHHLPRQCIGWPATGYRFHNKRFSTCLDFCLHILWLFPWWIYLGVVTSHMLLNDWMHMNVSWRSNWLEWIMVMPRYHHIHHSDNPIDSNVNFGVTFTIWDRIFGIYLDPDMVKQPISFGIGEKGFALSACFRSAMEAQPVTAQVEQPSASLR